MLLCKIAYSTGANDQIRYFPLSTLEVGKTTEVGLVRREIGCPMT